MPLNASAEGGAPAGAEEVEVAAPRSLLWDEVTSILMPKNTSPKATADGKPGIQQLYRALFCVRQTAPTIGEAADRLLMAMEHKEDNGNFYFDSTLFRHECCYLLGQMGADEKTPTEVKQRIYASLCNVLKNFEEEDEVTRHEAAEGLAAVFNYLEGDGSNEFTRDGLVELLTTYSKVDEQNNADAETNRDQDANGNDGSSAAKDNNDNGKHFSTRPLAETCEIAIQGLQKEKYKMCACQFSSYDPAMGDPAATEADIPKYTAILADGSKTLYERYVAMFTLRNLRAVDILARSLLEDETSAVLRHEICFILGQIEEEAAVTGLIKALANKQDHAMVRHEAAIALGSIGSEEAKVALREWTQDTEPMVAESCLVALDTIAYWEAWEAAEERIKNAP